MIMNDMEKKIMNSRWRSRSQRKKLGPLLLEKSQLPPGLKWLEIGCGQGMGADLLKTLFKADEVFSFDLDPDQVNTARKNLAEKNLMDGSVHLAVSDAAKLPFKTNGFDAVLNFGIIHHCPDWRNAISEIARVLKPSGKFVFEEVFGKANRSFPLRYMFKHPEEGMFSYQEFCAELERNHLKLYDNHYCFFGYYILGVAEKMPG